MVFGFGGFGGYNPYSNGLYGLPPGNPFEPQLYPYAPNNPYNPMRQEKPTTGFAGFVKGLWKGAADLGKSIFTFPGILTTAAAAGLAWATGGAALLPMAAIGAGIGLLKTGQGAINGSSESAGKGIFLAGLSLLALKFSPKSIKLGGQVFKLGGHEAGPQGISGRLQALFGRNSFVSQDGSESKNLYQMGISKFMSRLNPASVIAAADTASSNGGFASAAEVKKAGFRKMTGEQLDTHYTNAHLEHQRLRPGSNNIKKRLNNCYRRELN